MREAMSRVDRLAAAREKRREAERCRRIAASIQNNPEARAVLERYAEVLTERAGRLSSTAD
jgi:hypothetical protein